MHDDDDDAPTIATVQTLLRGYVDAADRFERATKATEPEPAFIALFEALNWAVALDDRIGKHWRPDGQREPLGWRWRYHESVTGAEMIGGVRFARNSVHHQWSDALYLTSGPGFPVTFPVPFFEWRWVPADQLPEPDHPPAEGTEQIYRDQLEGRPARLTLDAIGDVFARLQKLLEPHTLRPSP